MSEEERKLRRREAVARWRKNNPERALEQTRAGGAKYRKAHPDKVKARGIAWRSANPDHHANYCLERAYGISLDQRDRLLAAQGDACAICRADSPGSVKGWNVDHCHSTGHVRGVLCCNCNLLLGHARDNPATLDAAINYLIDHNFTDEGRNGEEENHDDGRGDYRPHRRQGAEGHVGEPALA